MKRYLPLFTVTILLLVSCSDASVHNKNTPTLADTTGIPTTQPNQTSSPTPVGTWEMVIKGVIFEKSTGNPISGASISYIVGSSFFPEIQEGRLNKTISNEHGEFSLPMIVHDTDTIKILVEARAFLSYEESLDLFGDRSFNIGLSPYATATVYPP